MPIAFPIELTFDKATQLVNRAIVKMGADYRNVPDVMKAPDCAYFENVNGVWLPDCIIGHVLAYLGVHRLDLFQKGRDFNVGAGVFVLRVEKILVMDDVTFAFLGGVQNAQDNGHTWGEARLAGRQRAEDVRKVDA